MLFKSRLSLFYQHNHLKLNSQHYLINLTPLRFHFFVILNFNDLELG